MQATDYTRSRSDRGPEIYYGYCGRTRRYRMMDLPDYMSNIQQGITRMMSDPAGMYQEIARGYSVQGTARPDRTRRHGLRRPSPFTSPSTPTSTSTST